MKAVHSVLRSNKWICSSNVLMYHGIVLVCRKFILVLTLLVSCVRNTFYPADTKTSSPWNSQVYWAVFMPLCMYIVLSAWLDNCFLPKCGEFHWFCTLFSEQKVLESMQSKVGGLLHLVRGSDLASCIVLYANAHSMKHMIKILKLKYNVPK